MINLDDVNETAYYIPYREQNAEPPEPSHPLRLAFDLPNGPELRWNAYKSAWVKCLDRVQTLVHELYEPVVAEVVEKIESAYNDDDQTDFTSLALPHFEIPTIAVANSSSADPYFLSSVIFQLRSIAHLYPADCVNLSTAMKSIISGFLSTSGSSYRSSAKILAAYDINVLVAWYSAQKADTRPQNLILLLHDFEQFDPGVLQDVLYICSQHVPSLPLVVLISLSSPQSPLSPQSYLHVTYPRSTLKLMRIQSVIVPSGPRVLEEVIIKTFVDLSSVNDELDIVPGPAVLEFLVEYATRFNPSVHALLNILQLAHLKHFLTNPLTALASLVPHLPSGINALSLEPTLQEPGSTEFKELLVQRLTSDRNDADNSNSTSSLTALTRAVHVAWSQFRTRTRSIRLAYLLLQGLHDFLSEKGYKGLGNHWGSTTVPAFMSTAAQTAASTSSSRYPQYLRLQNYINLLQLHAQTHSKQSAKDITYARTLLRKLRPEELRAYLNTLIPKLQELQNELGVDIPTGGDEGEERSNLNLAEVVRMLEEWRSEAEEVYRAYETVETGTRERNMNQAAVEKFKLLNENLAEWMYEYLGALTTPIESIPLWDVCYTGSAVFPSETLNPSIRASVIAGLLRPKDFAAEPPSRFSHVPAGGDGYEIAPHKAHAGQKDTQQDNFAEEEIGDEITDDSEDDSDPLHTFPDTSVLFHRYLESGKMINVYDWFESFHTVIGIQRRETNAKDEVKKRKGKAVNGIVSPAKKKKGKEKARDSDLDGDEEMKDHGEEPPDSSSNSEERHQLLVQARFIRALHELEFLGFIKHTRRKPDHVLRTVFDVGD
ncbi:origin recognition complex subunit 3 N-terminus-domain-containing protein [Lentinula lateritia]|uniref:Origin recognition complex subunit 3 N-terminus-domain-containing protein n=1 Tax=Lentinula lateritia TaxID=40482 RepID=A0ABQ8VWF7_9AGAR|nr:origin recognition complex subunit 3 N-terminus-domain-containing protein [Lentinula lateritia]